MRTDWLKAAVLLSTAAGVWLWTSASSPPALRPLNSAIVSVPESARPAGAHLSLGSRQQDDRGGSPVVGRLDSDAKARSRRAPARKFRKLSAKRDPQLEADPQFQKLLELDSARKMALLQQDDVEAQKRIVAEMQNGSARISRRVFEQALLDPNAEVRLAALFEISLERGEPPLTLLAPVLEGDPNAEVRLEALDIIGDCDDAAAEGLILGAIDDPDDEVRSAAEELLETRHDELL